MTISIIDRDYLIKTLIDLVRIDSTNPSCTESSAGEGYIAHYVLKNDAKYRIVKTIQATTMQILGEHTPTARIPFWIDAALLDAAGVERAIIDPIGAGLHTTEE